MNAAYFRLAKVEIGGVPFTLQSNPNESENKPSLTGIGCQTFDGGRPPVSRQKQLPQPSGENDCFDNLNSVKRLDLNFR